MEMNTLQIEWDVQNWNYAYGISLRNQTLSLALIFLSFLVLLYNNNFIKSAFFVLPVFGLLFQILATNWIPIVFQVCSFQDIPLRFWNIMKLYLHRLINRICSLLFILQQNIYISKNKKKRINYLPFNFILLYFFIHRFIICNYRSWNKFV